MYKTQLYVYVRPPKLDYTIHHSMPPRKPTKTCGVCKGCAKTIKSTVWPPGVDPPNPPRCSWARQLVVRRI